MTSKRRRPRTAARNTDTEVEVMKSTSVRDAVADELGFRPSVSISTRGETDVVQVSAESTDAERAAGSPTPTRRSSSRAGATLA